MDAVEQSGYNDVVLYCTVLKSGDDSTNDDVVVDLLLLFLFIYFYLISLTLDEPNLYHPACGH